MTEHRPEVADVFRTYEKDFFARWGHVTGPHQKKAFEAIRDCRTAAPGGHVEYVEECDTCGHRVISYNSCRDRHCPRCQARARAKWLTERQSELLPVPYFHVVFTLPQQVGGLALQNAREIYGILFRAASETLLTIAADPKRLGAAIGFLAVLHTWGQNLHLHPHLHCVVPGGGMSQDGSRWIGSRKSSFFLPVRVLGSRFRNVFLAHLREAFRKGRLQFHGEMAALARFRLMVEGSPREVRLMIRDELYRITSTASHRRRCETLSTIPRPVILKLKLSTVIEPSCYAFATMEKEFRPNNGEEG